MNSRKILRAAGLSLAGALGLWLFAAVLLPVLLTYSGNERILSDTTQTETKAAVESLPDGQVVLDPFVNGDHNYTSEDPTTNTQLDADLRQVTVDFLTYHLQ